MAAASLHEEIETRVEQLGFELVELERAGSRARPILRLRIDRPDAGPDESVTLDECAHVSRELEKHLDERDDLSDRYVLEVSSPGVERPLLKPRDWIRFAGKRIAVKSDQMLADRSHRLEGELIGLQSGDDDAGDQIVQLRLDNGDEVEFPLSVVAGANLVFEWKK